MKVPNNIFIISRAFCYFNNKINILRMNFTSTEV